MPNIHATAVVSNKSTIEEGVTVGPYCVIGDNVTLKKGVNLISHVAIQKNTFIDENTTVYPFATIGFVPQDLKFENEETRVIIGKNNSIREHVSIHLATKHNPTLSTVIGDDCLLMACSHVAHDCKVGNGVVLANNVLLAGHTIVEDHAIIAGGSGVHQFNRVGTYAIVGAMSGVGEDIVPYALYTGARETAIINGVNIIGLKRHGFSVEQINNIRAAYDILFDEGDILDNKLEKLSASFPNNKEVTTIINFIKNKGSRSLHVRYHKHK
ncbi:acyl-ACP--UDP-N-acetylglucosamine O-acyltransferase [Rickettsiales bacterium LUAb2]